MKNDDDTKTTERNFREIVEAEGWCDQAYLDKTFTQAEQMPREHREEFYRKMRVLVNSYHSKSESTRRLAKKLYGEIAGFVNDHGAMERVLTPGELECRREFAEEKSEVPIG